MEAQRIWDEKYQERGFDIEHGEECLEINE